MARPLMKLGLQEGDSVRIITDCKERIYIKAVKTRGGYVKLELDIPERFWADKIWKRNEAGERIEE